MGISKILQQNKVINGTYGKCVIDGEEISACKALKATVDINTEEVLLPDSFMVGNYATKGNGKGSMTIYKIDSYWHHKIGERILNGIPIEFDILSELNDPKAYGAERVIIKGAIITTLTVADWERAKLGEIEVPFVFRAYEAVDLIK